MLYTPIRSMAKQSPSLAKLRISLRPRVFLAPPQTQTVVTISNTGPTTGINKYKAQSNPKGLHQPAPFITSVQPYRLTWETKMEFSILLSNWRHLGHIILPPSEEVWHQVLTATKLRKDLHSRWNTFVLWRTILSGGTGTKIGGTSVRARYKECVSIRICKSAGNCNVFIVCWSFG